MTIQDSYKEDRAGLSPILHEFVEQLSSILEKPVDRIAAMRAGLSALSETHDVLPDGMRIEGRPEGNAFASGEVDSCGDHRIAMSFAIASLRAAGAIRIRDVANVAASFPAFVPLAQSVGLAVHETHG
jgi:5-enolpyruvylshikimate-3-phosphate synthase